MALYDDKLWLLSHIRNSFISTDDTGMCEMVMVGEDLSKNLAEELEIYKDPDESEEDDDDIQQESYEIQLEMDLGVRARSNTAARLEKLDMAKKRMSKVKHVKWDLTESLSEQDMQKMFVKKEPRKLEVSKSFLSEQLENCVNLPQNQYMEYAKFDGSAQIGIPIRKYKIFLTMLPEEQRNYPMIVLCIATAKIQELIGLILLKCSMSHGDCSFGTAEDYGLYITEEDGEVDHDFPCLDPKECVAKFGFTCLGLVEHKQKQMNDSYEETKQIETELSNEFNKDLGNESLRNETKKITEYMKLMKVHKTAMEAPLYKSYRILIVNKMRAKAEIQLGISGEKLEIDPVQQKSAKFTFVRQKPVSHHIDSIVWCEITDMKSNASTFRIYYTPSHGFSGNSLKNEAAMTYHQSSASFKYYDFETDHATGEEIVEKINLILELRSSANRREYLATKEKKLLKKKSSTVKL